jgi:hypothetical protein
MTRIRLDYVHEFLNRHGRVRRYFRRNMDVAGAIGFDPSRLIRSAPEVKARCWRLGAGLRVLEPEFSTSNDA